MAVASKRQLLAMRRKPSLGNWTELHGRKLLATLLWWPVVAIVALFAFQVSFAGALRDRLPQLAVAWVPYDADARAGLAAVLSGPGSSERAREVASQLARESIIRSPLSVVGLRALALSVPPGRNTARARSAALMAEAQRLSRRDYPTQEWLIEQALRRGNVAVAMQHFDIGMRSSQASRQYLFPMLANASADPRFAAAIKRRLRERPEWRFEFVDYMVRFEPDPKRGLDFAREFLNPRVPDERADLVAFIGRLSAAGEYSSAWELYTRFALGLKASGVRDGGFEGREDIAPFGWALTQEPDLEAHRELSPEGGKGHVLVLEANSGRIGQVARQLLKLDAGDYKLRAVMGNVPQDAFERPQVTITCAARTEVPSLLALKAATPGQAPRGVEDRFSVPQPCQFQWLTISVSGDGPPSDNVPWIDDIEVVKTGGRYHRDGSTASGAR
jgi:hypothetical protein